jgi:hypothetical protein
MFAVVAMVQAEEERTGKAFDWVAFQTHGQFGSTDRPCTVQTRGSELAIQTDVDASFISRAMKVFREAPDIANRVLTGEFGLRLACDKSAERQAEAAANQEKLNALVTATRSRRRQCLRH